MKIFLPLLFFAILLVQVSVAQKLVSRPDGKTLTSTGIDKIVKQLMDTAEVTGLCLGIINDNKIAYLLVKPTFKTIHTKTLKTREKGHHLLCS